MFNFFMFCFILLTYLIFGSKNEKSKLLFLRIIFIVFTFLVGFRAISMGNDTLTYLDIFDKCKMFKWDMYNVGRFEKGYLIFNILLGYLKINHRVFLIILSIIFNYFIYRFIKNNSKNYFLSVIIYFGLMFFYLSMTMFRQFFAMVIIITSYEFIKHKKLFKFLIFVALASFFHSTAIISLLLYPIYHLKFKRKNVITILFVTLLCFLFVNPLMNSIMSTQYFNYSYEIRDNTLSLANSLYSLVYLAMLVIAYFNYNKQKNKLPNGDFVLYVFLITFCLNFISIKMNIFNRISDYFSIFSIICLPNLISTFNMNNRKYVSFLLIILLIVYSSTIIFLRPEWNSGYNYKICNINSDCFY